MRCPWLLFRSFKKVLTCLAFVFCVLVLLDFYVFSSSLVSHEIDHANSTKIAIPSASNRFDDDNKPAGATERQQVVWSRAKRFIRRPWKDRPNCANFTIQRTVKGSMPPVALASYPGSGNTWVRSLIEAATGIYSGSIYKDVNLYLLGFWGELADWNGGETVVQKTHDYGLDHIRSFSNGRAIFLTRNPYDAVLSFHNFLYGGHTGYAPSADYVRPEWPDFFMDQTRRWLGTAINWTDHSDQLLVVHYERLKEDPLPELRRILRFLQLPVDEKRLDCIVKYPQAKFRRKSRSTEAGIPPLPVREAVDRAIRYADFIIRRSGNPALPLDSYSYYNNSGRKKGPPAKYEEEQSWYEWIASAYSTQWSSRFKSVVEDPLTSLMREEASAGIFYSWALRIDPNFTERIQLGSDFNSGPPPYIRRIRNESGDVH